MQLANVNKNHGLMSMVNNRKTKVKNSVNSTVSKCPLHNAKHALIDCRGLLDAHIYQNE